MSPLRPSSAALRAGRRHRRVRGISIVELMVGITISLFILAGASLVLTSQLDSNRRLLLEAQLQQDLRTTADMISRDVRRAGYWGKAYCNIWPAMDPAEAGNGYDPANCARPNPYNAITPAAAPAPEGTPRLVYDRSTDSEGAAGFNTDDGVVDGDDIRPRERVGFQWNQENGTIEYMVGANNWQTLTDPAVMRVTQFNMVLTRRVLPAPCAGVGCQALGPACNGPMTVQSRDLSFTIVAQAAHDPTVQRSLRENVRLRNSIPVEQCP